MPFDVQKIKTGNTSGHTPAANVTVAKAEVNNRPCKKIPKWTKTLAERKIKKYFGGDEFKLVAGFLKSSKLDASKCGDMVKAIHSAPTGKAGAQTGLSFIERIGQVAEASEKNGQYTLAARMRALEAEAHLQLANGVWARPKESQQRKQNPLNGEDEMNAVADVVMDSSMATNERLKATNALVEEIKMHIACGELSEALATQNHLLEMYSSLV
ncbi:MAG: hypothetical protein LBI61_04345 [Puniceicoccales bacterium]|jgi:hypothetical protein|nr:hypothetical protein [Puniceicoccales bacterium]